MTSFRPGSARAQNPSPARRIMALDYGRKRIGVAISDELGLTAHPLAALKRTNRRDDLRRLQEIANKNGATAIVIGLPLHLSGRRSEMAEEAERFAMRLQKEMALPVKLRDERLTSWEAEELVKSSKPAGRADLDSLAAAILLREYLEEEREHEKSGWRAQT